MPGLFSEFHLKDVRLRNRIAVSPMTMYSCAADGIATDFHLMHLGARAAGGAGLVVMEQLAVSPEGRMTPGCAGIWGEQHVSPLRRITDLVRSMGSVPGVQLGHTGRKGGIAPPWEGYSQLPNDHPDNWEAIGPTEAPFGGERFPRGARAMTHEDIARVVKDFADGACRALDAGFEWLEMHYAHGFLGAAFFSPLANTRDDEYGGSLENRARFLFDAFDAVRAVWPERLPLTMRIGAFDYSQGSHTLEDTIWLVREMMKRGLDLVDVSMAMNGDDGKAVPWTERGFMLPAAARIRAETSVPTATSWNLGDPVYADQLIRREEVDLLMLGRPTLANPHWPLYAAMALGENAPFDLLPVQYGHALRRSRVAASCSGFGFVAREPASE